MVCIMLPSCLFVGKDPPGWLLTATASSASSAGPTACCVCGNKGQGSDGEWGPRLIFQGAERLESPWESREFLVQSVWGGVSSSIAHFLSDFHLCLLNCRATGSMLGWEDRWQTVWELMFQILNDLEILIRFISLILVWEHLPMRCQWPSQGYFEDEWELRIEPQSLTPGLCVGFPLCLLFLGNTSADQICLKFCNSEHSVLIHTVFFSLVCIWNSFIPRSLMKML